MTIKNLFFKPLDRSINGVVKADQNDAATVWQELDEYVVTNELEKHFRSFFESYSTDLDDPSIAGRVGVWISGFFGSGKSHFLKTLSYLLENITAKGADGTSRQAVQFFDENKLRDAMIRADIDRAVTHPADVILFNIDSKASSNDQGNPILNVFLRVFNEYQGFSGDYPHIAHMERHLAQKGVYQAFCDAFAETSGMQWQEERDGYQFYQDDVEQALARVLNLSQDAAHKWFEESEETFSVSVENFCHWVKEYLDSKGPDQRMVFMVDEVGQFIGSDSKLMLTLQTITENLGTICQGRAWIVVTSQADMDAVLGELASSRANDFSKIAGRFKTRLSLSSSNTDEVIQKRLLRKTPEAEQQLRAVWEQYGDILRNQITFDRSGPTLRNFDGPESFIANYPFAPYHFQLVQKVFEEIRKVGATGAHLAYGERSMLDAFQMAAMHLASKEVGALVPMHAFYSSVEGFLDTAVKRTIDQAAENTALEPTDIDILRILFMIRYVDLIKGTVDNLVTLSIDTIDSDKLALRKRIEESLHRLEKENLIIRNGEEFLFLTNEEQDITRKIKATDIASNEENRELANLIFKDLLKDQNKYRHRPNKTDYSIGRYLDGHSLDGRYEADLRVEVISPLDLDYAQYGEAGCINKSAEGTGQILIKLPDNKTFLDELRTWLKTNKFIRLNDDGSSATLTRILADRGRENQERRKRLRATLEEMLLNAQCYALGQHLKLSHNSLLSRLDDACQYLLENTYTKLSSLQVLQQEPLRELKAVLTLDDIGQMGLVLDSEEGNPKATRDVEQYISLRTSANDRLLVSDIVERFSKRPYGWPDNEILLILARLAAAGRLTFHAGGPALPLDEMFERLTNSRKRSEVSVQKKRQTEEAVLKKARSLSQELFNALGPDNEKELYAFYRQRLEQWLTDLTGYENQMKAGRFPGKEKVASSIQTLKGLLSNTDSVEFFQQLTDSPDDYLDLEEDYRDLHEFFTRQLHSWKQLSAAITHFEKNRPALERDEKAKNALKSLHNLYQSESPYDQLHRVAEWVEQVEAVNTALLNEKRSHALERVEEGISQLQSEIHKSGMETPELSNRLLRPLQLVKSEIETETSIANIYLLQTETARDRLDEALYDLEVAIQAEIERQEREAAAREDAAPATPPKDINDEAPVFVPPAPQKPVARPRPIVEVSATSVFNKVSSGIYLESSEDIDRFVEALREELQSAVEQDKRVRLR